MKKKWKYLRDQFAVELKKFPTARPGDPAAAADSQTSKWQYFHLLHFLKDVLKPRPSRQNFPSLLASNAAEASSPHLRYQMDGKASPLAGEEGMPASPMHAHDTLVHDDELTDKYRLTAALISNKKRGSSKLLETKDYNQTNLDTEKQNSPYLMEKSSRKRDKEEDEDIMFFKSLLPHVKRIPVAQKLIFRGRIQEVVQQFAYQVPATSQPPASVSTPKASPHSYTHSPAAAPADPYPHTPLDAHSCTHSPADHENVSTDSYNVSVLLE